MRCKLFIWALLFILFALVVSAPHNTPIIDGSIAEWDENELVGDDPGDDSHWGSEFDNVYVTWDSMNLYIGLAFSVSENAMVLYIETGNPGGVTDFNSSRGYDGAYPRNITFPDSIGIDIIVASWDGQSPYIYATADNSSEEFTSSCETAVAGAFVQEAAIPWNEIYPDASGIVLPGAYFKIVGVIAGGDDYGAGDAVPDNPEVDGGAGPQNITEFIQIPVDTDNNGFPDSSLQVVSGFVIFDDSAIVAPPYPITQINAHFNDSASRITYANSSPDDGGYSITWLQSGIIYDFTASVNGFKPDTASYIEIEIGDNYVDFTMEPYRGSIYGIVSPSDFQTTVYAMQNGELAGFSDTTEVGIGEYEISHLGDGTYDIFVDPSSSEYSERVIEGIEIIDESSVELDIVLERAGVIREVNDEHGDDYGPGWYEYPTNEVFVDGVFDIEYIKIRDIGESYQFEISVLEVPPVPEGWYPEYSQLALQKIDIYIDCHSGGSKIGLPERQVTFVTSDAWDFAISADGWSKGIFASNGQEIYESYELNTFAVDVEADTSLNRIWITVKKNGFEDNLGQIDTSTFDEWDIIVLIMGNPSATGLDHVRWVNSGTQNEWEFNNGADGDIDPNVIDLLQMPGVDQYGTPKQPGRTQEEMLDYVIESPVVLEITQNIDITPPKIEYNIPDEIVHLSGTKGVFIEVGITDDVAITGAFLHWRNLDETQWHTPIPLGYRERSNTYIGDIPFDELLADSFEFFFEAEDPTGNLRYDPQEYPDSNEPEIPSHPYSTITANPGVLIPAIAEAESIAQTIAVNTFIDEKELQLPDGLLLIFRRNDIALDVDTIFIRYKNWTTPDSFKPVSPDLIDKGQFRELRVYSEHGGEISYEPVELSFHYFESADEPFDESTEERFVLAAMNPITETWISSVGGCNTFANTISCTQDRLSSNAFFGLFEATMFAHRDEPISEIILSPNPFSPNDDGVCDKTNITLVLNYDGRIDMDIFDLDGSIVKHFVRDTQLYSGRNINITWDGRDNTGNSQPMGIYLLSARLTYIFEGKERLYRKNVAIAIIR